MCPIINCVFYHHTTHKNGDLAGAHCLLSLLQLKVETSPEHIAPVMNVLRGEESLRDIVSKMDDYLANE